MIHRNCTKDGKVNLFMLGTDHMLTHWNYKNSTLLNTITYKFLTSSPEQLVVSEVEDQVYVKLRDSNVRSFGIN